MSLADDSLQSVYDLVLEMRTLVVRLDGTPSQPGAIAQTGELVNAVSAVVEKLTLLIDRLIAAAELHEQLKVLPTQLLRPDQSEVFRKSVREAMTCELTSAVESAREQAATAGVAIAISDLRVLVIDALKKAESEVFGEEGSRVDLFYKLKKSESQLKRLTILTEQLSNDLQRISALHRDDLNDREDKARELLAAAHQSAQKRSITCLLIGLVFGCVFGSGYLTPKIETWLASELIYKPTQQGRG